MVLVTESLKRKTESRYQNSQERGQRNPCVEGEGGVQDASCTPGTGNHPAWSRAEASVQIASSGVTESLMGMNVLQTELDN